jgi:hypothetical protein
MPRVLDPRAAWVGTGEARKSIIGATMSTRTLILLAALCAVAILGASALQILLAR